MPSDYALPPKPRKFTRGTIAAAILASLPVLVTLAGILVRASIPSGMLSLEDSWGGALCLLMLIIWPSSLLFALTGLLFAQRGYKLALLAVAICGAILEFACWRFLVFY